MLILADTERQSGTQHALKHKARGKGTNKLTLGAINQPGAADSHGGGGLPDVDETAGGQVNLVSQQVQQLHSVVQTQSTAGGRQKKKITVAEPFST